MWHPVALQMIARNHIDELKVDAQARRQHRPRR